MRPFVIITVRDEQEQFSYDMEVPTDVPVSQVTSNIAEVLNYYKKKEIVPMKGCRLINKRTKKGLPPDSTFGKEGIWQGDVLYIKEITGWKG